MKKHIICDFIASISCKNWQENSVILLVNLASSVATIARVGSVSCGFDIIDTANERIGACVVRLTVGVCTGDVQCNFENIKSSSHVYQYTVQTQKLRHEKRKLHDIWLGHRGAKPYCGTSYVISVHLRAEPYRSDHSVIVIMRNLNIHKFFRRQGFLLLLANFDRFLRTIQIESCFRSILALTPRSVR